MRHALSLTNVLQPVQNIDCIGCLVKQGYYAVRIVHPCPCCVDSTQQIIGGIYSFTSLWGRTHISSEMREATDVLQMIYKLQRYMLSDELSDPSGGSRHADQRDPQRQPSAQNEVASCHVKANKRASKQSNLLADIENHGGFKYAPQKIVGYREDPLNVMEEEGKLVLTFVSKLHSKVEELNRYLHELREGL